MRLLETNVPWEIFAVAKKKTQNVFAAALVFAVAKKRKQNVFAAGLVFAVAKKRKQNVFAAGRVSKMSLDLQWMFLMLLPKTFAFARMFRLDHSDWWSKREGSTNFCQSIPSTVKQRQFLARWSWKWSYST